MNNLPLLDLFTRLRAAGLPLGMDDYQLVLRAIQSGFGLQNRAALARLCRTLWVKSAEEQRIFDYHFEQVMSNEAVLPIAEPLAVRSERLTRSQIALCVGAGTVAFGLGFVGGSYLKRRTDNATRTQIINRTNEGVASQPGSTQGQTQTQTPTSAVQPSNNSKPVIPDWVVWGLLGIATLIGGYLFFRWVTRQITKRLSKDSSPPEALIAPTSASDLMEVDDEVQVAQTVRHGVIRGDEYFPVTRRQMKQTWRFLRRPVREGAPTELDVEATVNQIGRQGLLLEPVMVSRRVNRAEMLLLLDRDGSMVPFHTLSHRLAETAVRGGRLSKAGIYYFHNCPVDYLYHDPNRQEAELVSNIVAHHCSGQTAVLIFSDAGAARGGYSEERYRLTKDFVTQLKQRVRYMAWLNPMPRSRWTGTTAGEIAHLVPMFEMTRRGLQDAIGVLRGRSTNFERQRR